MGTISTGVGLISGIDTASLIDSLIALESRGKINLQTQLANLQTLCTPCHKQKTAREAAVRRASRRDCEEDGLLQQADRLLAQSEELLVVLEAPRECGGKSR